MTIPNEFTEAPMKANSAPEDPLYSEFLCSGEIWKSSAEKGVRK